MLDRLSRRMRAGLPAGALAAALCAPAVAMWMKPVDAPVARLETNVAAYLEANPNDPQAYFVLGRIHSLAYTLESESIGTFGRTIGGEKLPRVAPDWLQDRRQQAEENAPPSTPETRRRHLELAVQNFSRAIERRSDDARFVLGLAYVLEHGTRIAPELELVPRLPWEKAPAGGETREWSAWIDRLVDEDKDQREAAELHLKAHLRQAIEAIVKQRDVEREPLRERVHALIRAYWRQAAIDAYWRAYELSLRDDLSAERQPLEGVRGLVAYEAGTSYLRLIREKGEAEALRERVEEVEKNLLRLERKPKGGVTPIVLTFEPHESLADLLAPAATVCFDLDGDGEAEPRSWLRPTTALLVWDPAGAGQITSGRQLFGSVTWWMFFEDGYRALDALDDDRDGWLRGDELSGLALWFDFDSDGISAAGEVIPVEAAGVTGLATSATGRDGASPMNAAGATLLGGRSVPTYDWIEPGR